MPEEEHDRIRHHHHHRESSFLLTHAGGFDDASDGGSLAGEHTKGDKRKAKCPRRSPMFWFSSRKSAKWRRSRTPHTCQSQILSIVLHSWILFVPVRYRQRRCQSKSSFGSSVISLRVISFSRRYLICYPEIPLLSYLSSWDSSKILKLSAWPRRRHWFLGYSNCRGPANLRHRTRVISHGPQRLHLPRQHNRVCQTAHRPWPMALALSRVGLPMRERMGCESRANGPPEVGEFHRFPRFFSAEKCQRGPIFLRRGLPKSETMASCQLPAGPLRN